MKKLEDIPKQSAFEAPEGYFDSLPGIIQARITSERATSPWYPVFQISLRYVLPVVAIGFASLYFLKPGAAISTEELLASVDSTQLIAYLEEGELTTDELIEALPLNTEEANAIQHQSVNEMTIDDTDAEYLSNEFGDDYF